MTFAPCPLPPGILYFQGDRRSLFVRVLLAAPRLLPPARRLLEEGLRWGALGVQPAPPFEANIDFEIRSGPPPTRRPPPRTPLVPRVPIDPPSIRRPPPGPPCPH